MLGFLSRKVDRKESFLYSRRDNHGGLMHTTTYVFEGRDEALEAQVLAPVVAPRRRGGPAGARQPIPSAEARAQRARAVLARCGCR